MTSLGKALFMYIMRARSYAVKLITTYVGDGL